MFLGVAFTLAHELGLSHQTTSGEEDLFGREDADANFAQFRRVRAKRLLYVYINQLASRLGWPSIMPQIVSQSGVSPSRWSVQEKQWYEVMTAWISLTRLTKTASDVLFASATSKHLIQSGSYINSLEHFRGLLEDWQKGYLALQGAFCRLKHVIV